MNDVNVLDLEDVADHHSERVERNWWTVILLLAIRDGMDMIGLQSKGDEVRLWYDGPPGASDLVPIPVLAVPRMTTFIWKIGQIRRQGFLAKLGLSRPRRHQVPPRNWEGRFRIKLGDGLKDVFASATAADDDSQLSLRLKDVTILAENASTPLKRLTSKHHTAKDIASSE